MFLDWKRVILKQITTVIHSHLLPLTPSQPQSPPLTATDPKHTPPKTIRPEKMSTHLHPHQPKIYLHTSLPSNKNEHQPPPTKNIPLLIPTQPHLPTKNVHSPWPMGNIHPPTQTYLHPYNMSTNTHLLKIYLHPYPYIHKNVHPQKIYLHLSPPNYKKSKPTPTHPIYNSTQIQPYINCPSNPTHPKHIKVSYIFKDILLVYTYLSISN